MNDKRYTLHQGDCRDVMKTMDADSIDSIVSDPPYGIDFMGKGWDHGVPGVEFWKEAIRVAKPGAYLLAFGGTRTFHRLTVAIEDAGWEIRDCVMWVYGSGFPKSHDVSKGIDKAAGAKREVVGKREHPTLKDKSRVDRQGSLPNHGSNDFADEWDITAPHTEAASQWNGWGTALKPAWEPIIVARKPFVGTVAANVLAHGTGGINVDGCRVEHVTVDGGSLATNPHLRESINGGNGGHIIAHEKDRRVVTPHSAGRWPANLIHDGSDEVLAGFPITASGKLQSGHAQGGSKMFSNNGGENLIEKNYGGDTGSAARFFYCAKASKADRDENNNHPTVKPTALMRYLCRLVTQPNGIVLDPFMGSGSTGKAAILEGFQFTGIDITPEYVTIATARIEAALKEKAHQSVTLDSLL